MSRFLVGIAFERLQLAHTNMNCVDIILIHGPAQLLYIKGEPIWSTKLTRLDGKSFAENTIYGMNEFRKVFRMKSLHTIPYFKAYRQNERLRN